MASRARAEDVALAGGILTAGSSRVSGGSHTESESVQTVGVADCLRQMPRVRRRSLSSFTVASVRSLPGTANTTAPIVLCGSHAGRLFTAHISVRDYSPHTRLVNQHSSSAEDSRSFRIEAGPSYEGGCG